MYQILTWSLMYRRRTREKFWSSKVGKNSLPLFFAECQGLALGKPGWQTAAVTCRRFLPSARVCRGPDTRQKGPLPSA